MACLQNEWPSRTIPAVSLIKVRIFLGLADILGTPFLKLDLILEVLFVQATKRNEVRNRQTMAQRSVAVDKAHAEAE